MSGEDRGWKVLFVMRREFSVHITALFILGLTLVISACDGAPNRGTKKRITQPQEEDTIELVFGFDLAQHEVYYDTVQNGWTFSHILAPFGISQYQINQAAAIAADSSIGLKYVVAGRPFMVLTALEDTARKVQHLIYESDAFSYIVFDFFDDTIAVYKDSKPVERYQKSLIGVIHKNSNLTAELNKSFDNYNMTADLADRIEGIFAWSIDFFRLQPNDRFALVYQEKAVDSVPYRVDQIDYMVFEHNGKKKYAFRYMTDSTNVKIGYYDEAGREMKRPFLMAPVKFARISSGYNLNRIHPIYKTQKAHLGTDYAAPTGTPIMATADGTVSHATKKGANGIYVKIRHNKTYETQYLHMSRIADGIRPGVRVEQGQTIGYVGSTGAATGPHVCYRFWKNGKQINHRSEKFPDAEPMVDSLIPTYLDYIAPMRKELDELMQQIELK
jgi:murein DD-endopeptidase MepM/ murein hydrolase activator NlpD